MIKKTAKQRLNSIILVGIFIFQITAISIDWNKYTDTNLVSEQMNENNPLFVKDAQYDDQNRNFIFLFDESILLLNNATIFDNFTLAGGSNIKGPWKAINGFAGTINNSANHLGYFLANITSAQVFEDSNIETQMNNVHRQLQTYPAVLNASGYGLTGNTNASIAFLDTGIDDTNIFFNETYQDLNFSRKIIGWQDFTENLPTSSDINGHGTSIAAIAVGGGSADLEPNKNGDEFVLSVGGNFSHFDLFYPNHVAPGWYSIKIGSFSTATPNSLIKIQGLVNEISSPTQFDNSQYRLELYRNGGATALNITQIPYLNMTWNTTTDSFGQFDVFFSYKIPLGKNPDFTIFANISFIPNRDLGGFANFSGIAPETKVVSLKILNDTGLGLCSDLISALDWVWENNSIYHIVASLLSVGSAAIDDELAIKIAALIDKVIENGTMVIIAAGNNGVGSNHLNKLAFSKKALVVGAINSKDQVAYYSGQGQSIEGVIRPDIVAPGGSLIRGNTMINTVDANSPDILGVDYFENDLRSVYGTSVAAAIIAGLYNLIIDKLGDYSSWNMEELDALYLKSLVLMTATETGLAREDDPRTTYNEGVITPPLNRGEADVHEGYGRVNPRAVFDLLNNSFTINSKIPISLSSSAISPENSHIFASSVILEKDVVYYFNLSRDSTLNGIDADMYLYHNQPDKYGRPIILKSSTINGQGLEERFYYTNINATDSFYIIIKAVSGSGIVHLNISIPPNTESPLLNNTYFSAPTSQYNDSLDTFRFWVNYSHPENFPPAYVRLHLSNELNNISMQPYNPNDNNYIDGVWYYVDYKFTQNPYISETYEYHFTTQTGPFFYNYTDSGNNWFEITVNQIPNVEPYGYSSKFATEGEVAKWQGDNSSIVFDLNGVPISGTAGWNWITVPNTLENRLEIASWQAMYCGVAATNTLVPPVSASTPIVDGNNQLIYTYYSLTGTYGLLSPHFYLQAGNDPELRIGFRVSLNIGDVAYLQINSNRSGWVNIDMFTNLEQDWQMQSYNLSQFVNNFVQIRILCVFNPVLDNQYNKGLMLANFNLQDSNSINNNAPSLSKVQKYLLGTLVQESPLVWAATGTKFDLFGFQVAYTDLDGNLPIYVNLEIDGKNYSMVNRYGIWDAFPPGFLFSGYKGILFTCNLSLYDKVYTQFRFHTFDGKHYTTTEWQNAIQFTEIDPNTSLSYPLERNWENSEVHIFGNPAPHYPSPWVSSDNTWHKVSLLGSPLNSGEWYCGEYNYAGYRHSWDTSLVSPLLSFKGAYEIFLTFSHRLTFDTGVQGGDFGQILISVDYGTTWQVLQTYSSATGASFQQQIIDITKYMGKTGYLRFNFKSDATGIMTAGSGWRVMNIRIDTNRSKDYNAPIIEFLNIKNGEMVQGKFKVEIKLSDNVGLNINKTQFYFDGKLVNTTLIDNTIFYTIDSTQFENGKALEFVVIAYDFEGNRAISKVIVYVQNPIPPWVFILIYLGVAAIVALFIYSTIRKSQIKKRVAAGDYASAMSLRDRIAQRKFDREQKTAECQAILSKYDKNWEKKQPYTLYCKSCKKWFKAPEFEIYCPACSKDSLFIAKNCPVCDTWKLFEDEGVHRCRSCNIQLIKDFDAAKVEINARLSDVDYQAQAKLVEEKKEEIIRTIQEIPVDKKRKILQEIIEKIDEDEKIE